MRGLSAGLALTLTLVAGVAAAQQPPALPDGPGKAIMLDHCVDCHGVDQIAAKRLSETEWRATVGRMVSYGAVLTPAETEALVAYLTGNFGQAGGKAATPAAAAAPASPQRR